MGNVMDQETVKVLNAGAVGIVSTISGYCDLINPIITALIGIASFLYICFKIYWLCRNKGKEKE